MLRSTVERCLVVLILRLHRIKTSHFQGNERGYANKVTSPRRYEVGVNLLLVWMAEEIDGMQCACQSCRSHSSFNTETPLRDG